jgi:MYXO-CTERM domain-containing protein
LYYFAEVVGPGGLVPVNVNVIANGSLSSMGKNTLFGSFSRDQLNVNNNIIVDQISDMGSNTGAFSTSVTMSLVANQEFLVEMIARAFTQDSSVSATAFLDPLFSLDPSLVNLGYSILTSPGIDNSPVSATPVPAPLPFFAAGLGLMGLLGRRRKRKVSADIAAL